MIKFIFDLSIKSVHHFLFAGLLLFSCKNLSGQEVSTIDVVKIIGLYEKEGLYFYKANWEEFRRLALDKGVISGYELHRTAKDSANNFHLILITKFKDSLQLAQSEENFRPIMKAVSPGGPNMLNDVKRKDFLTYITGYVTTTVLSKEKSKKRKRK